MSSNFVIGLCNRSLSTEQSSQLTLILNLHFAVYSRFSITFCVKSRDTITVCTVVQDCCKGRSNKYRKWHFWGFCRPETPQPINMKFGMDDYVRDTTRHPKWHVSRIRGVTPTNG